MTTKKYDKDWNTIGHISDDGKTLYDKDWKVIGHLSDDGITYYDKDWNVKGHLSDTGKTIYDKDWNESGHISDDGKTVYDKNWNTIGHNEKPNKIFHDKHKGQQHRNVYVEHPYVPSRSDSSEGSWLGWLIGVIIVVVVVLVILYYIFVVIVPFLILNVSLIALISSLFNKSKKNIFLWISVIGFIYLLIDLQLGLLSYHLINNIKFDPEIFDYIFYGNTIFGLIATLLLIRPWIKLKYSQQNSTADSKVNKKISESTKHDLYLAGGLVLVAALMIFVYNITFKVKYSPNNIPTQTSYQTNNQTTLSSTGSQQNESNIGTQNKHESELSTIDVGTNWVIRKDLVSGENGEPVNSSIASIIDGLESYSGFGSRVTKTEFLNLFDRPESRIVYTDRLIRYATPKSMEIQKQEHQDYTKIFMQEKRQLAGIEFLKNNNELLSRVENEYGILKKDMVSLLMWESGLGEFTGDYQIFNVLMAQVLFLEEAQAYSVKEMIAKGEEDPLLDPKRKAAEEKRLGRRKKDASKNVISLLRECKASGLDPLLQKGSWGGAIGYVQFMPYNLKYAVDADNNGTKDLFSWPDAMFSAANYLKNIGEYNSTEAGRKKALRKYNPSDSYVSGVMLYADTIWERFLNGQ